MIRWLLFSLVLVLSGCSYYVCNLDTGAKIYPATNPDSVQLFFAAPLAPYAVLGAVAVDGVNQDKVLTLLKKRVTEIGADAVIRIQVDKTATYYQRVSLSGIAIKFVKNQ